MREPAKLNEAQLARRAALAIAPGVMFVGVAGGIAFPILPIAGLRAGLSLPFIGLIFAANRIARIFASPIVGVLADRIGGRRILLAGLCTQVVVMFLYWAGVVVGRPGAFFLAARFLHGPGSACVFVAAQVLALHAGGSRHGGSTAGVVRAALSSGMPVGLVVGGLLASRFGDRVTFEAAIVAMLIATAVAFVTVPDLHVKTTHHGSFRATLRVMSDRRVVALGMLNFATFFSAQGTVLTTLVLLIRARGLSVDNFGDQATASLAMGALLVVSALASIGAGRAGDRLHAHSQFGTAGLVILGAGLLATMVASSPVALVCAVALVGVGMGAMNPCLVALVGLFAPGERRGSAVGAIQLFGDIGGALGPIVGAMLLAHSSGAPFLVSALLVACVLPAGFWLIRAERAAMKTTMPAGATAATDELGSDL